MQRSSIIYKAYLGVIEQDYDNLLKESKYFLHTKELKTIESLPALSRRHSYLLGRAASKNAIKEYLKNNVRKNSFVYNHNILQKINITNGIFEQPILENNFINNLELSISHCENIGVSTLFPSVHPIGIDLEVIDNKKLEIINNFISKAESDFIKLSSNRDTLAAGIWSAREALSKVFKTGLMVSNDIFAVTNIKKINNMIITYMYKNFFQYKAASIRLNNGFILTIAYPKNTVINLIFLYNELNRGIKKGKVC
tara:strand:- start:2006 stop:2767 length:762 start_codon:yes stop_codon:yes gene_type:complete